VSAAEAGAAAGQGPQVAAGVSGAAGGDPGRQRLARAALSYLAEPGDPALGALLQTCTPTEVLAAIKAGELPLACRETDRARWAALTRAVGRWRLRLADLPPGDTLAASISGGPGGIRLACPGDPEWPAVLDDLGLAAPCALWLRGAADLAAAAGSSVSIVGSRTATGYGVHVAGELAGDLAEQGRTIVSGGAYGIDAAVHRGALMVGGTTIVVLACGVDHAYPAGHDSLFAAITERGLVISELPPGSRPTRLRFLVRNRVIAALTQGTVVIEAGERSGALNTARHAAELNRPLMAVPGPVTSAQSAGCHRIIRDWNGALVTCTEDVRHMLEPIGCGDSYQVEVRSGAPDSRDDLDLECSRVLDAFPVRAVVGMSTIARKAGVEPGTVLRCLGVLAGCGFVERADGGWRLTRKAV
jgi:DNA processing protein